MTPDQTAPAGISALKMMIGGQSVDAADGQTFEIVNPATGAVIATAPMGGKTDVDRAVEAARKAFDDPKGWSELGGRQARADAGEVRGADQGQERGTRLARDAERRQADRLVRGEIIGASLVFDYYAGAANKVFGQTIPVSKPGLDLTLREPIGVVGLIVPWNFPLLMASWKLGPALAAGNTCILKPASLSPMTALRIGELALEAGFPAGVINVVTGPGGTAGAAIAAHPGIGKVAFTGRDDDRPGDHAAGVEQRQEDQPGARRQEPQRHLRGRGSRAFRGGVAVFGLRQLRTGLLRAEPDPRRALGPRPGRGAVRGGDAQGQGRQSRG